MRVPLNAPLKTVLKGCGILKRKKTLLTLFSSMFSISSFTIGGGAVIVPLMRKKMVEELGWLTEEDMLDVVAIAQSSPGAVAINVASQLGYRIAGLSGQLVSIFATVLPPFLWISVISLCYDAFRTSPVVDAFLRSMQPAVAAVILCAAISMLKPIRDKKKLSGWILFAAGLALGLSGVNVIWILLIGGVIGALVSIREVKRHAA